MKSIVGEEPFLEIGDTERKNFGFRKFSFEEWSCYEPVEYFKHTSNELNIYKKGRGHLNLTNKGYNLLKPTSNLDTILNRQEVLKAFTKDIVGKNKFYQPLNRINLIQMYTNIINHMNYNKSTDMKPYLERLDQERNKLSNLFKEIGMDNLSEEIKSSHHPNLYEKATYSKNINDLGHIIIYRDRSKYLKINIPYEEKKPMINHSFGKFDIDELTGTNFYKILVALQHRMLYESIDKLSPLLTIYQEAHNLITWEQEVGPAVIPTISKNGNFEIKNGINMYLRDVETIPISFSFKKSSNNLINGIHSGGKSTGMNAISSFLYDGQCGFWLPADKAKIFLVDNIINTHQVIKRDFAGTLESELAQRWKEIKNAKENDIMFIDEFLIGASPDAAEDLEPVLLNDYKNAPGTKFIVTHRGESITEDSGWNIYSPDFKEEKEKVKPLYQFVKGRTSQEILKKHALQLFKKAINTIEEEKESHQKSNGRHNSLSNEWYEKLGKRIKEGRY